MWNRTGVDFFSSYPILVIMLAIRFQRVGRRNDPAFRIVVGERRSKPQSSGIEVLGSFHPKTKQTLLRDERILYWISKGAQLSDTVRNLLVAKKVISRANQPIVLPSNAVVQETAVLD